MFMKIGKWLVNTRNILFVEHDETSSGGALIVHLSTSETLVYICDPAEARVVCEELGKFAG